ncbi:type I-E CRISPR-associated protein Cse2/CasB [Citrobacter sedlakii]|uniref:type I-E CRISPR-associated protein Cse2/CasB n=1 Tax=Citrobacter sedlakii TaxID=67826 RepID=UPI003B239C5D
MNFLRNEHKTVLRQWHGTLQEKRGLRASLRRSKTLSDAYLSEGFRDLLMQTHTLWKMGGKEWRFIALALTAALAAQVKSLDERQSFAEQLGHKDGNRAVMSELRFARLSAVKTPDELLRQLRRAVQLLKGTVNLISLAEDVFRWCQENDDLLNHHRRQQRPTEFIRIRWALEYYQAGDNDKNDQQG